MPEKSLKDVPRAVREYYEKGTAALQRNNLDYAIALYKQVLQQEPAFLECRQAMRAAQMKKAARAACMKTPGGLSAPGAILRVSFRRVRDRRGKRNAHLETQLPEYR